MTPDKYFIISVDHTDYFGFINQHCLDSFTVFYCDLETYSHHGLTCDVLGNLNALINFGFFFTPKAKKLLKNKRVGIFTEGRREH